MATGTYYKTTTPYTGLSILIYTGENIDAIWGLVALADADGFYMDRLGRVFAFGELIEPGDAVAITTDEVPLPAAKISHDQLIADDYTFDAVVYTGSNLAEVRTFIGPENVEFANGVLYVNGAVVDEDDAVAKRRVSSIHGRNLSKVAAATLAEYTLET